MRKQKIKWQLDTRLWGVLSEVTSFLILISWEFVSKCRSSQTSKSRLIKYLMKCFYCSPSSSISFQVLYFGYSFYSPYLTVSSNLGNGGEPCWSRHNLQEFRPSIHIFELRVCSGSSGMKRRLSSVAAAIDICSRRRPAAENPNLPCPVWSTRQHL